MSASSTPAFNKRAFAQLKRLYVDTPMGVGEKIGLDKDQSHYLVRVLRMEAGAEVIVFNGRDGAYLANLSEASKTASILELTRLVAPQPQMADLIYMFAPLKTGRLDYVVQKAVEMGATALQPILTEFTQTKKLNETKLVANIIEAAEQCETLHVPQLLPSISFDQLIRTWSEIYPDRSLIVCNESAEQDNPIEPLLALKGQKLALLVGPEGGFSPDEQALLAKSDFIHTLSLGPRILRADTAAVAALGLVQALAGDWYEQN